MIVETLTVSTQVQIQVVDERKAELNWPPFLTLPHREEGGEGGGKSSIFMVKWRGL